jgi:hypothetical protein
MTMLRVLTDFELVEDFHMSMTLRAKAEECKRLRKGGIHLPAMKHIVDNEFKD